MQTGDRIAEKLRRDVMRLERDVKFRKLYIFKKDLSLGLANVGLGFDYFIPFILSGVLIIGGYNFFGSNNGFNEVMEVPRIERTITSTGIQREKSFADDIDEVSCIQYSTGWFINDNGLYEREITTFEPDDNSVFSDVDSLLVMNLEELSDSFKVAGVNKIQKSELDDEDMLYNEEMVIVNRVIDDINNAYIREKTDLEKGADNVGLIVLVAGLSFVLFKVKENVFKDRFKNWLKQCKESCRVMSEVELKRLYDMKKKNLELFDGVQESERPKIKSRGGRR